MNWVKRYHRSWIHSILYVFVHFAWNLLSFFSHLTLRAKRGGKIVQVNNSKVDKKGDGEEGIGPAIYQN